MATILYSSTHGSDDPTRATIPFVMALGAVEAGHQAEIALIGEAAHLAKDVILAAAQKTKNQVVTVEDHYAEGGLGDAVAGELSAEGIKVHKLAVYELPRSGKPAAELVQIIDPDCFRQLFLWPCAPSHRHPEPPGDLPKLLHRPALPRTAGKRMNHSKVIGMPWASDIGHGPGEFAGNSSPI